MPPQTPDEPDALRIGPVRPGEAATAVELLFAELEPAARAQRVAKLRERGETGFLGGLWAAYRGRRLVGAMRAEVQAGRTALVAPPRIAAGEPPETAQTLLARALAALPARGVKVAQALLPTDHGEDAEMLAGAGFRHAADLLYLMSGVAAFPTDPPAEHLEFLPYSAAQHGRLADVVRRTYGDSLDCRAIDNVREVDDVLAGYRATGTFDPSGWLIARHEGRDAGCLLISSDAAGEPWELTYMGVVPELRGRGFGVALARHAQWLAKNAGCVRLALAVDAANHPAIAVYASAGFVAWDRRSVFLRVF